LIIIADSSPLISLAIIDMLELLEYYFDEVYVPYAVYKEVSVYDKPFSEKLKQYLKNKVSTVENINMVSVLNERIDLGEAEAITLAFEKKADFIILDDLKARKTAKRNGLNVIGTLGLLLEAKKEGKIKKLKECIQIFSDNDIRLSEKLIKDILFEAEEI
jgi:predicted nucleic acid-binding protein